MNQYLIYAMFFLHSNFARASSRSILWDTARGPRDEVGRGSQKLIYSFSLNFFFFLLKY